MMALLTVTVCLAGATQVCEVREATVDAVLCFTGSRNVAEEQVPEGLHPGIAPVRAPDVVAGAGASSTRQQFRPLGRDGRSRAGLTAGGGLAPGRIRPNHHDPGRGGGAMHWKLLLLAALGIVPSAAADAHSWYELPTGCADPQGMKPVAA
jgi:hypothetical protein